MTTGFLAASQDLFPYLVRLKQAADLHTNRLSQWLVLQHLRAVDRTQRLERLVAFYRERRNLFAAALERQLGDRADWSTPVGGLFFWATLRQGIDSSSLFERARARSVLFTPGGHFLVEGAKSSSFRLNFSLTTPAAAERGLEILRELLPAG